VSLVHSDSTFLNEQAQMHLTDRQQWVATAKTPVRSLLTIVGAKHLSRVGATRLTLVGAIEPTLVGAILIARHVATGMCDSIDRKTELSSSSVDPRTQRTYRTTTSGTLGTYGTLNGTPLAIGVHERP
jgi:hypothetical protein